MKYISLKNWFLAIRPKTLPAAIAPVLIGTAMAFGDGIHHWLSAFMCLLGALTIQIGTNLANDYFDFKKGADTSERIGPTRVTQAGLIKPNAVLGATIFVFILSALICLWVVNRAGWPFAVIGILAILSGIFYTAGPRPLGYLGLGEVFVFIFFGPVSVAGTYYVQSFELNTAVILAGLAPGFWSVAILCVNNLRDIETDRKTNKRTLAVRFGRSFALTEYIGSVLIASLTPILIYLLIQDHLPILYSVFILFLSIPVVKTVCVNTDGSSLNQALATTGKMLFIYSLIFSIGWII